MVYYVTPRNRVDQEPHHSGFSLIKVKNDHRSKFSNFKQLERGSLKNAVLQRDSNP